MKKLVDILETGCVVLIFLITVSLFLSYLTKAEANPSSIPKYFLLILYPQMEFYYEQ